jgi:hypothetical protein
MRTLLSLLVAIGLVMPVAALADEWKGVTLIDKACGAKFASNPDQHPTDCLKKCAKKGEIGFLTSDGTWLKLDKTGAKQAHNIINKAKSAADVHVDVTGDKSGDLVKVKSLKLAS